MIRRCLNIRMPDGLITALDKKFGKTILAGRKKNNLARALLTFYLRYSDEMPEFTNTIHQFMDDKNFEEILEQKR